MHAATRQLIQNIGTPKALVPEAVAIKGGTLEGAGGLLIDGRMSDMNVVSMDGSLIHVSATAVMENCTIEGRDVLIEGRISGVFNVKGKCEIGASAIVSGRLYLSGDLFSSKHADVQDLTIVSVKLVNTARKEHQTLLKAVS